MAERLYTIVTALFCVIVVLSNIIGAKFFEAPFFEEMSLPAGMLTYPLTFFLADFVTEIYGSKKAKAMVLTAFGMAIVSYGITKLALLLPNSSRENQAAFDAVMGVNGLIVFSSLTAYGLSQFLDIRLYTLIHQWTGDRFLWLRNNGSTLISQIIDTITVNLLHLYWGLAMDFNAVVKIILFFYAYKAFFSILNTPLFYLCVHWAKSTTKVSYGKVL